LKNSEIVGGSKRGPAHFTGSWQGLFRLEEVVENLVDQV
jgi:hypothetical protein